MFTRACVLARARVCTCVAVGGVYVRERVYGWLVGQYICV